MAIERLKGEEAATEIRRLEALCDDEQPKPECEYIISSHHDQGKKTRLVAVGDYVEYEADTSPFKRLQRMFPSDAAPSTEEVDSPKRYPKTPAVPRYAPSGSKTDGTIRYEVPTLAEIKAFRLEKAHLKRMVTDPTKVITDPELPSAPRRERYVNHKGEPITPPNKQRKGDEVYNVTPTPHRPTRPRPRASTFIPQATAIGFGGSNTVETSSDDKHKYKHKSSYKRADLPR